MNRDIHDHLRNQGHDHLVDHLADHEHVMSVVRSLLYKLCQAIARVLTSVLFDLKVYGKENVPPHGGALLVSNHQSYLDPILLTVQVRRPLNYIAKSELFSGRIGGWIMRNVFNSFPVRQGTGDVGAVRETIQRLREGHLLNIYPEGARCENGKIGKFLRGVGLIVHRAGVPVVPVAIVGAFDAWPIDRCFPRARPVYIAYGPPIALDGMESDEIVAALDRTLRAMFDELTARTQRTGRPIITRKR